MTRLARFSWFEYEGRDPVFDHYRPNEHEYQNPVIAGFYPDPSILRVGADYYLVTSTFSFYPGVPIFHSRDLVNWRQIGNVLDRPSQLDLEGLNISEGIYAPALRYHEGMFYLLTTLVGKGGNFIVTADHPAGPWSDPVWLPEVVGFDPSIFFDDDGRAYIVNNGDPAYTPLYQGHKAIWIQEFDLAEMKTVGERRVIVDGGVDISKEPIWIEGPHIHKVDGVYYLIAAEGGTAEDHSEVVFRSDHVFGPFIPNENNPILTQRHLDPGRAHPITSTGHADIVQTPEGEWWTVFLGTRPYESDLYNTGRETFMMPLEWRDGWPTVVGGTDPLPFVRQKPNLPPSDPAETPLTGNFVIRDNFDVPELAPYWMFIRTPRERWYMIDDRGLHIEARAVDIGGRGQPSFIGRRQQYTPLYQGHKAIWIQEFDLAEMKTVGERRVIVDGGVDISKEPIWIEGPHIHKVDGVYYLIAAEGGTAEDHSEVVFRSDHVFGPFIPNENNPILTQRHLDPGRAHPITSTGHADIVQTPEGEWWTVFLGTRPYESDLYNTGRETFMMPLEWRDGWPTVVGGTDPLPFVRQKPNLPPSDPAETPLTGNFVIRDNFDVPELAPYWMFIRTPRERWYMIDDRGLHIEARAVDIGGRGQPSFIGRRQQHMHATATVKLRFNPEDDGDRAGLVAFQNDDFYLFIGVSMRDGSVAMEAERKAGGEAEIIASETVDIGTDEPAYLRIDADGGVYRLSYSLDGEDWRTLVGDVDGRILSTRMATGFVGTMIGMYAATEG